MNIKLTLAGMKHIQDYLWECSAMQDVENSSPADLLDLCLECLDLFNKEK